MEPKTKSILPNKFLLCITIISLTCCVNASKPKYELDRVVKLPGQPKTPSVSQFSGHITVNKVHGRALFYWFFEAQSNSTHKPLLLWLNGGPGCSSVNGASEELGPLRIGENGAELLFNEDSLEANLLFLESPIGVGFSYTNTSSDFSKIDDTFAAEDAYIFLIEWFKRFPQYKGREFFISGESYAGHYVPQLAELVYDGNKNTIKSPNINLKGFIVGNAETDDHYDSKGILEYAWSHSVICDEEYDRAVQACDFRLQYRSNGCDDAMNIVYNNYDLIDIYNIYAPSGFENDTSSSIVAIAAKNVIYKAQNKMLMRRMKQIPGGSYDPNDHVEAYFNRIDVQSALHVINHRPLINGSHVKWEACNDSLFENYNYISNYNNTAFSILPTYKKLINGGLKIWMYSGDLDGRVPFIGSRYCIEALHLPLKTNWTFWFHNQQVAGRFVEYEGITYVTVRGAGHFVPRDKPGQALALIHSYLSSQPLSTHR